MNFRKDRKTLLMYEVFKGQTTNLVTTALEKNHFLSKKFPNCHTDLLQPLDLTVNKRGKSYLSNRYQDWYADQVTEQLNRNVDAHAVKVDVKLSTMKTLGAEWIIDFYNEMQLVTSKSIVKKGFKIAHIRDAYDQAQALRECADNPFLEMEIESKASRT